MKKNLFSRRKKTKSNLVKPSLLFSVGVVSVSTAILPLNYVEEYKEETTVESKGEIDWGVVGSDVSDIYAKDKAAAKTQQEREAIEAAEQVSKEAMARNQGITDPDVIRDNLLNDSPEYKKAYDEEVKRFEQERLEQERLEQERLEQERLEQERLEQERQQQEFFKWGLARAEEFIQEQERLELERQEQERIAFQQALQDQKDTMNEQKLKLTIARDVIAAASVVATLIALGAWAVSWFFGISIPKAVTATALSVSLAIIAGTIGVAILFFVQEETVLDMIMQIGGILLLFLSATRIVGVLKNLYTVWMATMTAVQAASWANPSVALIVIPLSFTTLTWIYDATRNS